MIDEIEVGVIEKAKDISHELLVKLLIAQAKRDPEHLTNIMDAESQPRSYTYDPQGRLKKDIDALNHVTEYNYVTVAGSQIKTVRTTNGFGMIQLAAGQDTSDITVTNLNAGYTIKLRDAFSS